MLGSTNIICNLKEIHRVTSIRVHEIRRPLFNYNIGNYWTVHHRDPGGIGAVRLSVTNLKDATCWREGLISANFCKYRWWIAASVRYNNFDFWHRLPNDDDNDTHAQCDRIVSRTKAIGNRMNAKKNIETRL